MLRVVEVDILAWPESRLSRYGINRYKPARLLQGSLHEPEDTAREGQYVVHRQRSGWLQFGESLSPKLHRSVVQDPDDGPLDCDGTEGNWELNDCDYVTPITHKGWKCLEVVGLFFLAPALVDPVVKPINRDPD